MRYLIFADEADTEPAVLTAAVADEEASYLLDEIVPRLEPMTGDEYVNGPLAIHTTWAPFCYILHDENVFWCVEWEPGLLVFRFSPTGTIDWAAIRSTLPAFVGRPVAPGEWEACDEDAPDPLYNIVFDAWDAEPSRESRWRPPTPEEMDRWRAAMAYAEGLGNSKWDLHDTDPESYERWLERCQQSAIWSGVPGGKN